MAQDRTKDWRKLCEAAENEQDPDKLLTLVQQIVTALDEDDRKRKGDLRDDREIEVAAGECVTGNPSQLKRASDIRVSFDF